MKYIPEHDRIFEIKFLKCIKYILEQVFQNKIFRLNFLKHINIFWNAFSENMFQNRLYGKSFSKHICVLEIFF